MKMLFLLRDNHDNDNHSSNHDSNNNKGNNDDNNGNNNSDFHKIDNENDDNYDMIDKTLEMMTIIRMMIIK